MFSLEKRLVSDLGSPTVCSLDGQCSLTTLHCSLPFTLNGIALCTHCSHGEALTFEPLLMEDREQSPLKDLYIVAIATVTQVCAPPTLLFQA